MTETENQQFMYELQNKILDDRASGINRWLAVIAIVLTFFAIVVAIAGFLGFSSFQEIKTEAKNSAEEAKAHAETAYQFALETQENRDKSRDLVQDIDAVIADMDPKAAELAVKDVRKNPEAILINRVIADAILLQEKKKWTEAIEKWRAIANITEGYHNDLAARAWLSIGYLLHVSGKNPEDVISAYDRSIRLNPNNTVAYNNRANARGDLGQIEGAFSDYNEAIRLKPDNPRTYYNRGNTRVELGQLENAIIDYDKAIQIKPAYADAYNNRGVAKYKLGHLENAITDYNEAIRLKPDYADNYYNRGVAKGKLGHLEDAISDYDEAIRLKPDHGRAFINRGIAKMALGRIDDAIIDFDESIRLEPDVAQAYNNRGIAKYKLGQFKDAITDYDKAIRLKHDYTEAKINRANAKKALGR